MITIGDIKFKYSVPAASAGGVTAQASPDASFGKYASTTNWEGNDLNGVYANVTPSQNAAGLTDYRCIFIHNTSSADSWQNVLLWLEQITGGSTITIGLDPTGIVDYSSSAAQSVIIPNDTTAPAGVSFSTPGSGTELSIGNLGPGKVQAIWIKRYTYLVNPIAGDGFTIRTKGTVL